MTLLPVSFWRDQNSVPLVIDGIISVNSKILVGNNTTVAVPIFGIVGAVQVQAIWGVVTTVLGANNTAAAFRLNDQTAQSDITLSTGTTLSAAVAGSLIVKKGLAAAAVTLLTAAQERVSEPTTLETWYFSPFVTVQKTAGVATNIEFVYTTTDAPTSGAIDFYLRWLPLTQTASVTNL